MTEKLPKLPVPSLASTKDSYLTHASALVSQTQLQKTQQIADDFFTQTAPQLQQDLMAFAAEKADTSWLHDAWLESYLNVRETPVLTTSGGFFTQLKLPAANGVEKLAHFIHCFARLSADYLHDRMTPSQSNRGEPLDMRQWQFLQGMARVPQPSCDQYTFAGKEKAVRYAIVFWKNRPFLLPMLNASHQPYSVGELTTALQSIVDADMATGDCPVTAISLAGAKAAHQLIAELSDDADNRKAFAHLNHSLFHLHLVEDFSDDHDKALKEYTFLANTQLWAYKPMTLCADLRHGHYYSHIEHSPYDGGTIQGLVQRVEALAAEASDAQCAEDTTDAIALPLQTLNWALSDAQIDRLHAIREAHREKAEQLDVKTVEVNVPEGITPPKLSQDALMQLIMQYAQLTTFDCIRNTYESVDVSHFQAGRTECIRPVSHESIAFVTALRDGSADLALLEAAVNTHKSRIKQCKKGQGFNRHLLGLQLMAGKRGLSPDFFKDPTYQLLTTDILSTSSLGNRWHVGDFSFAPTAEGGLGISYFTTETGYWFCIIFKKEQEASASQFAAQLQEGCKRLYQLFA